MKLEPCCMKCLMDSENKRSLQIKEKADREQYSKKVNEILEKGMCESAPEYLAEFTEFFDQYENEKESFTELKTKYNKFMMNEEEFIINIISKEKDPLKAAIQAAQTGNYIDFIAMEGISEDKLIQLLSEFTTKDFDDRTYEQFKKDLETCNNLVYLLDNCGEIVLDKLLMNMIKQMFPDIKITAIVRGKEIGNDVTVKDAEEVNLYEIADVVSNGTNIAGTTLHKMPKEVTRLLENAEIVISKGQANYETLNGYGDNIYYLFLCKCVYFFEKFDAEFLSPIFYKEQL